MVNCNMIWFCHSKCVKNGPHNLSLVVHQDTQLSILSHRYSNYSMIINGTTLFWYLDFFWREPDSLGLHSFLIHMHASWQQKLYSMLQLLTDWEVGLPRHMPVKSVRTRFTQTYKPTMMQIAWSCLWPGPSSLIRIYRLYKTSYHLEVCITLSVKASV